MIAIQPKRTGFEAGKVKLLCVDTMRELAVVESGSDWDQFHLGFGAGETMRAAHVENTQERVFSSIDRTIPVNGALKREHAEEKAPSFIDQTRMRAYAKAPQSDKSFMQQDKPPKPSYSPPRKIAPSYGAPRKIAPSSPPYQPAPANSQSDDEMFEYWLALLQREVQSGGKLSSYKHDSATFEDTDTGYRAVIERGEDNDHDQRTGSNRAMFESSQRRRWKDKRG